VRDSHTRNFEVDHVTEKRVIAAGVLRRITVAVVIDGAAPRSKEELDKIGSLVRSAVGFDERRGDAVTVEAVPFLTEPPPAPPPSLMSELPFNVKKVAPFAAGGLLLVVLLLAFKVRAMRKRAAQKRQTSLTLAAANAKEKAAAQVTVEILGQEAANKPTESPDDLRRLVRERAMLDPATAALVVRGWLGSAERAPAHDEVAA
jgi:flagellar M-ring protein FliF